MEMLLLHHNNNNNNNNSSSDYLTSSQSDYPDLRVTAGVISTFTTTLNTASRGNMEVSRAHINMTQTRHILGRILHTLHTFPYIHPQLAEAANIIAEGV